MLALSTPLGKYSAIIHVSGWIKHLKLINFNLLYLLFSRTKLVFIPSFISLFLYSLL